MRKTTIAIGLLVICSIGYSIYVAIKPSKMSMSQEFNKGTYYGVPIPDNNRPIHRYNFQKGDWEYEDQLPAYDTINPNYVHPYYKDKDSKRIREQEIEDYIRDNEDDIRQILEDNF